MQKVHFDFVRFSLAMLKCHLRITDIARTSGVSRTTIANVRDGLACSERTAKAIAEAMGVPLADLITETEVEK